MAVQYPITRLRWLYNVYIYEFLYNFDTVLYKFLKTGTSDLTYIGPDQLLRCLGYNLYPISFYLTVLLSYYVFSKLSKVVFY